MADHKPLYRWSLQDAIAHNEVQDWRDSYKENCDCARAIERAIADHYHDNILADGTKDIIDRYGFDRREHHEIVRELIEGLKESRRYI